MAFSDTLLDQVLNDLFRSDQTPPATVYIALMKVMPNQAGSGGTEVTGTGYARQAVARGTGSWSAPAAGTGTRRQITNSAAVDFGTAGSDWAPSGDDCDGFAIYSAASAGTYYGKGTFAAPLVIQNGNPVKFNAGELKITAAPGT